MSDDFETKEKELLATKPVEENFASRDEYLKALEHWKKNDGGYLSELRRERELLATKPVEEQFDGADAYRKALEQWQKNEGKLLKELYEESYQRTQLLMHEEYLETIFRKVIRDRLASRPRKIPIEEFDDWVT